MGVTVCVCLAEGLEFFTCCGSVMGWNELRTESKSQNRVVSREENSHAAPARDQIHDLAINEFDALPLSYRATLWE